MRILVTGGAGFIGSEVVRQLIARTDHEVLVFDKLTYSGLLSSLASVSEAVNVTFSVAACGFCEDETATAEPTFTTVWETGTSANATWVASPAYFTVIVCAPAPSARRAVPRPRRGTSRAR